MKDIEPRFFDTKNKILAHLEWEAIKFIHFDVKHKDIAGYFPRLEQRQFYWIVPFTK